MKINNCSVCGKLRPLGIDERCQDCLDDCNISHDEKELKELQEENDKLRNDITKLIGIKNPNHSPIWVLVNKLVENELQQEEICDD